MKTALITGASSGIGLELARIFARNQTNLILVARSEAKLHEIAKELSSSGIDVKIYAKDLSILENAREIYEDLKSQQVSVDYLINNAGFGVNGNFTDTNWEQELQMLNLNIMTLTYLTKIFARDMVSRKEGRIMNIGSTGAFQPGPYMAAYCASKAYVLSLSEAVNYELRGTGVTVTTLCPGVTETKFHDVADSNDTAMWRKLSHATAAEVAGYGFKIMMKGKPMGVYGRSNKWIISMNRLVPRCIATAMSGNILKKQG